MTIWDEVGEHLEAYLRELSEELLVAEKGFRVSIDRYANEAFPLRVNATYSPLTSPGDEHVVVSFDVKCADERVVAMVDIARGDGRVLAERQILEGDEWLAGSESCSEHARAAGRDAEQFLREHTDLLATELQVDSSEEG